MLFEPLSIPRFRLAVISLVFVAGSLTLLVRLWNVQVSQGKDYTAKLRDQTTVAVRLSPARGGIYDRNGVALAENRASFDIDFYLDELVRNYSREHRGKLPRVEIQGKSGKVRREVDIVKIVSTYLEPVSRSLGFGIAIDEKALRRHYYQNPTIPFQYRSDIDFNTLAQFSERNLGVPGIQIAVRPVRHYNYGAMAAHILGYVGEPDENTAAGIDGTLPELVGKHGLERVYDGQLQGVAGGRILQINYKGYIEKEEAFNPPVTGKSLCLTIDARIQYIVEQVLRRQGRAAAVVMDPNSGDILAMASVPSFDPNDFIPRIPLDKWKNLNSDMTAPLLNRALSSYVPGSTFKVVVSLAAFKTGKLTPNTQINCPPTITIGNHVFHNDDSVDRGDIGLHDALRNSVNTFYYQLGIRTGIRSIDDIAATLGLGQESELSLPEDEGIIPGPDWLKQLHPKERWTDAYTANTSIGQGYVQVNPLQMAVVMSAVANGGTVYYPRLVSGVKDAEGNDVMKVPNRVRGQVDVPPADMAALHDALLAVVENGTATSVQLPFWKVAGKTGTAQAYRRLNGAVVRDLRTWFYCFAPYEKPRYVVCTMVEGGQWGGSTNGPLVHDILAAIHEMEETGKDPSLTYLTPAVGNFSGVTDYTAPSGVIPNGADVPTAPAVDEPINVPDSGPSAASGRGGRGSSKR